MGRGQRMLAAALASAATGWVPSGRAAEPVLPVAAGAPGVRLVCGAFALRFGLDGRPASLQTPDGTERLDPNDAGPGFVLRQADYDYQRPTETLLARLSRLRVEGSRLTAASEDGQYGVDFTVKSTEKYLALRIAALHGIPADPAYSLHFETRTDAAVRAFELDYMTAVRRRGSQLEVNWYNLYNRNECNPPGGFAFYVRTGDDDEDDTILRIWAEEDLPHPRTGGPWDLAAARAWTARWMQTFRTRGQLILAGNSLAELKEGIDFARQAEIRQIYLYTQTWREGGFWPTVGNCAVNPAVFPRGMADLQAFSEFCQANGMSLAVHCVSLAVGFRDRRYMVPRPDRRLAAWCSGTLAEAASADSPRLLFRPAPGTRFPTRVPQERTHAERERPGAVKTFFDIQYVRIGDEIVRVGEFRDTGGDVWVLENVARGQHASRAEAHPAGTDAQGLWCAYGQALIPDNDSTLLEEMVDEYAGMVNACRLSQTEYDGAEDHCHEGEWGFRKLAAMVYARLDHPVMAHTSGGNAPPCHTEYRLNAVRRMMAGDDATATGSYGLPYVLDGQGGRPASSRLDAHFTLSLGALAANGGIPNLGLQKPFPQDGEFGISAAMFRAHGLTPEFLTILKGWRTVGPRLTPAQLEQLRRSFVPQVSGNHPGSALVHVLRQGAQGWEIVPTRVLTRREGDILWHREQELGTFGPLQTLRPGETLELENPFAAQPLQVILRVRPREPELADPVLAVGAGTLAVRGTVAAGHYLTYTGGARATVYDANWNQRADLAATPDAWRAPQGWFSVALRVVGPASPAVELRLLAEDGPSIIHVKP